MRPVRLHVAVVFLGLLAAASQLAAQNAVPVGATAPAPAPIGPSTRTVPPGMTYHRVWVISPLVGSGKSGDPRRPVLVPAPPPVNPKQQSAPVTAAKATPAAATAQTGLLGFQMQLSDDGQYALAEMVFASPLAFQNALKNEAAARNISISTPTGPTGATVEAPSATSASLASALQSAVPGLQIFERGVATESQVLAAFQQKKAGFTFNSQSVRP